MDKKALGSAVVVVLVFTVLLFVLDTRADDITPSEERASQEESLININSNTEDMIEDAQDFEELKVEVIEEGTDGEVESGDLLTVHYRGSLIDGTEFDSSYNRGDPFTFEIGSSSVIQGWEQGLLGQQVGSKVRLEIPSSLGYGPYGQGQIPPNAGLIFEVEILEAN